MSKIKDWLNKGADFIFLDEGGEPMFTVKNSDIVLFSAVAIAGTLFLASVLVAIIKRLL